jgi:hypothetical protein
LIHINAVLALLCAGAPSVSLADRASLSATNCGTTIVEGARRAVTIIKKKSGVGRLKFVAASNVCLWLPTMPAYPPDVRYRGVISTGRDADMPPCPLLTDTVEKVGERQ